MVLAAPGLLLTPPPGSVPVSLGHHIGHQVIKYSLDGLLAGLELLFKRRLLRRFDRLVEREANFISSRSELEISLISILPSAAPSADFQGTLTFSTSHTGFFLPREMTMCVFITAVPMTVIMMISPGPSATGSTRDYQWTNNVLCGDSGPGGPRRPGRARGQDATQ